MKLEKASKIYSWNPNQYNSTHATWPTTNHKASNGFEIDSEQIWKFFPNFALSERGSKTDRDSTRPYFSTDCHIGQVSNFLGPFLREYVGRLLVFMCWVSATCPVQYGNVMGLPLFVLCLSYFSYLLSCRHITLCVSHCRTQKV